MSLKNPKFQTSLIIPAYNEQDVILDTLTQVAGYIKLNQDFLGETEIVVVAAGTDKTSKIAQEFKKEFKNLTLISPPKRGGKGRDVRLGFKAAKGDVQIFMDADLATPIHHIKETVEMLRSGSDVVIGVRKLSKIHPGKLRTLFSIGSNIITRTLLFPTIRDTQCGYKGFTKSAAKKAFLRHRLNGWGFDIELLQLARENKLKVSQQVIPDWQEVREEGLRGDGLLGSGFKTLADLILVRIEAWARFMTRHWRVLLGLSLAASFLIPLYFAKGQSVWFDEGYSIILTRQSFSDLISLTAVDAHPPFYYLVLKVWSSLVGSSELALRSLSALFGTATALTMFLLIKKVYQRSTALVALPFIILAPFLTRYNYEIRMYSLVAFICSAATLVLIKAKESNKSSWWALYGLLVALGMYTLYMSALVWFAHGCWLLYEFFKENKFHFRQIFRQKFVYALGLSLALFSIYIPTLISQFQNSALPSITKEITFEQLSSILSFMMSYKPGYAVSGALTILLLTFLAAWIKQTGFSYSKSSKLEKKNLRLVLSIIFAPIVFLSLVSLIKPYFIERYLAHFIVFYYALIGIAIERSWRKGQHRGSLVLSLAATLTLLLGMSNLYQTGNFNFQNLVKPSAQLVRAEITKCDDQTTVVADEPFVYIDAFYYYDGCDLRFFSKEETGPYGGYAPLRYSSARVSSASQLTRPTVYHLSLSENSGFNIGPENYQTVRSVYIDKYTLTEYKLKD